MNALVIIGAIILISGGGLFFLFKKMKLGKKDWEKLKLKFKKKKSLERKAFEKGEIVCPIDKRDYVDFEGFKKHVKDIKPISEQLKNIDKDFKNWNPIGNKKEETK